MGNIRTFHNYGDTDDLIYCNEEEEEDDQVVNLDKVNQKARNARMTLFYDNTDQESNSIMMENNPLETFSKNQQLPDMIQDELNF